jgi:hypothetical protein
MTNDQAKRLAFNETFEKLAEDRSLSLQARSFLQWRIAKNREVTAVDRYVEDLLKREERPGWTIRLFK